MYRLIMSDTGKGPITIVRATPDDLADLERLVAQIEAEDHPEDPEADARAPAGMAASLARYDALSSDSAWFLIAYLDSQPVGLAILTRIPKLDDRVGFLYLDELHVLAPSRRRGIGRALLRACIDLAEDTGLAGVRLLTRPDNRPAQALYEAFGFEASDSLLYQWRVDREEP